jgi:hypothetical protein
LVRGGSNDRRHRHAAFGRQPRMRAGRKMIAFRKANTPSTQIPTSRNGSVISHTTGASNSASSASGQHSTNNTHQTKKVKIVIMVSVRLSNFAV